MKADSQITRRNSAELLLNLVNEMRLEQCVHLADKMKQVPQKIYINQNQLTT